MAIEFTCPACGGTLRVDDDTVGQLVRCGGCMTMLRVPESTPPPSFPGSPSSPFPDARSEPDSSSPPPVPRRAERSPAPDNDSHGEPVRRTRSRRIRREPPPPTGRGPMFWVMITVLVLGLGSCVFCCGLSFLGQERWRTLDSSEGGFKVELPAAPRNNMSLRGLKHDPNFKIEGTRVFARGDEFAVLYRDIDRFKNRDGESILDQTVAELNKTLGKGAETKLNIGEFPARDVKYHPQTGGNYQVRVILAESRLYILIVGSHLDEPDEVQRFFSSFEITDQKLHEAAKERKERVEWMAMMRDITEASLDVSIAEQEAARLERERQETIQKEHAWLAALGQKVGEMPMKIIAAEQEERRQVVEVGKTQTELSFQAIAREKESFERERVTNLGISLAHATLEAIAVEQALAADNRVKRIGLAIGTAVTAAAGKK